MEIYNNILVLLKTTIEPEVLWVVLPLFIATIVMIVYFEKYAEEKPGWNTYVANSLVLLFVSIYLLRFLYNVDGVGLINYITFLNRFVLSLLILFMGIAILFTNFSHFLPEKIAKYLGSPLTLNLIAYIAIVMVYSPLKTGFIEFISSLLFLSILWLMFNGLKILISKFFIYLKKLKEKEKREDIIELKKPIQERKKGLKRGEISLKKEKKEVIVEEKKVVKEMLSKLDNQKKEAIKLKKLVKKK